MIQVMHKQGYSKKRIARELGISINTVRKYIQTASHPVYRKREFKPMKLDPYREYVKKTHRRCVPALGSSHGDLPGNKISWVCRQDIDAS